MEHQDPSKPNWETRKEVLKETETASVEAVREGRATPTPAFALENQEMHAALMEAVSKMDETQLEALTASLHELQTKTHLDENYLKHFSDKAFSLYGTGAPAIMGYLLGGPALAVGAVVLLKGLEQYKALQKGSELEWKIDHLRELVSEVRKSRERFDTEAS